MSRHVFVWGTDQEYGNTGWILKGMPHFDASLGDTVGHDCMEHLPGGLKHGVIADEMLALGVRLYLRVETGWWPVQRFGHMSPTKTCASEVERQLEYIMNGTPEPGPARSVPTEDEIGEEMERIIGEAVPKGVERFNREFGEGVDPIDPHGELATNLANWLRVGVRAGMQRWNRTSGSGYDAAMLMEGLARDVIKLGTSHEEGEELVIEINEARMNVLVHKRHLEDIYPEVYA